MRRPPIGALWIRAQTTLARDVTTRLSAGSALVLSPHPDDETIACGLLLATKAARDVPVAVAVATDGGGGWYSTAPEPPADEIVRIRHDEWHRGLDALGVPPGRRHELGLPDGDLDDHDEEAVRSILELLEEYRPDQVFVTAPDDLHADHRSLCGAAVRAVASTGDRAPELFAYRVYPATGLWPEGHPDDATAAATALQLARSVPTLVRDRALLLRAPAAAASKRRAIAAHASQRRLLDGELRYVWGTDVELFRPLDPSAG